MLITYPFMIWISVLVYGSYFEYLVTLFSVYGHSSSVFACGILSFKYWDVIVDWYYIDANSGVDAFIRSSSL